MLLKSSYNMYTFWDGYLVVLMVATTVVQMVNAVPALALPFEVDLGREQTGIDNDLTASVEANGDNLVPPPPPMQFNKKGKVQPNTKVQPTVTNTEPPRPPPASHQQITQQQLETPAGPVITQQPSGSIKVAAPQTELSTEIEDAVSQLSPEPANAIDLNSDNLMDWPDEDPILLLCLERLKRQQELDQQLMNSFSSPFTGMLSPFKKRMQSMWPLFSSDQFKMAANIPKMDQLVNKEDFTKNGKTGQRLTYVSSDPNVSGQKVVETLYNPDGTVFSTSTSTSAVSTGSQREGAGGGAILAGSRSQSLTDRLPIISNFWPNFPNVPDRVDITVPRVKLLNNY